MRKIRLVMLVTIFLLLLVGCGANPTPISQSTPIPSGVKVVRIEEEKTTTNEITQHKMFDQCNSASNFKAQVQFSQSSSEESQKELVLKATVGGEVGISEIAKVTLEGAIEQHFASSKSSGQAHQEGVSIEVPPYSKQEYNIVWHEIRRIGAVEYLEGGVSKTAKYDYRVGLELVNTTGNDLSCPGQKSEAVDSSAQPPNSKPATPEPTPIPAPTDAPVPTPTEPANTPPGSKLEVGEWWRENGVWLKADYKVHDSNLDIYLELWNKTGNPIIFNWRASRDFSLTDNTNHQYKFDEQWANPEDEVIEVGERKKILSQAYWFTAITNDSHFYDSSVTDMYFTVAELSRISNATWHIPLPK